MCVCVRACVHACVYAYILHTYILHNKYIININANNRVNNE